MSGDNPLPAASDVARDLAAALEVRGQFMFFRRKDIADVEGLLHVQQGRLDLDWVRRWLVELYGPRDLRVHQWVELVAEFKGER